jgi:hypothetical protein
VTGRVDVAVSFMRLMALAAIAGVHVRPLAV